METFDLDVHAEHRLAELSCLVDAIPGRFRATIVSAALGITKPAEWHDRPLVQSIRSQVRACTGDCIGFPTGDYTWNNSDLASLQPLCQRLSECTDPAQVQLVISQLVLQLAMALLAAAKEVAS